MDETPKLLYVVVVDGNGSNAGDEGNASSGSASLASFRYTRSLLQSTLQFMGCKPRHAFKISRRVFDIMKRGYSCLDQYLSIREMSKTEIPYWFLGKGNIMDDWKDHLNMKNKDTRESNLFELYKKRTTIVVPREVFMDVVCDSLAQYKYVGPNQRAELILACRIRERKESVTVLLCGTSGCGKSTLSALLASRLGVTTVISTDSIRHMMRSFADEKQNPLLWSSTYHAGEHLDALAVAKAKAQRKAKKLVGRSYSVEELSDGCSTEKPSSQIINGGSTIELISKKQMAVEGFKAQSEMVIDSLDRLISAWEYRKESVIVEGVHLSLNFVMDLMKKHPSLIPFMIYITNEDKHMERFAVRAKYMALDPSRNKYVKYIRNIRAIQDYLCNRADKYLVPKINNTNVDRSVAAIHATVFNCLRRRVAGELLYDSMTNTVPIIDEEYRKQYTANSLSSKRMFQLIQQIGSSSHLMVLLSTDRSIVKAWPAYSFNGSSWPSDTGSTSYTGSFDDSMADGDTSSRHFSSCCSTPRLSEGPLKEPKEGLSAPDSEEEGDDNREADTDEDLSDVNKDIHEDGGSVDEGSTKSNEYDDLAICDGMENGYWSDDDPDEDNSSSRA